MLETYGVDTNLDGLTYHGKTDIAILRAALGRKGIPDHVFVERLPQALRIICHEVSVHASDFCPRVCSAIPEILARLQAQGRLLGLASGNLESVGWHKVASAGLRQFFQFGSFGDHCERRCDIFSEAKKQARERLGSAATVCFVGDTPDDILAARKVDARIISVATGTFSSEELDAFGPDVCCESCADLLEISDK